MEGEAKTAKVEGCQKFLKKYFKKIFQKGIDKRKQMWYNRKAFSEETEQKRTLKIEQQTNLKEERNPEIPKGHWKCFR